MTRARSYWLAGAVAYGLSWPASDAVNLSFLAWFAFVPLFAALSREADFNAFARRVAAFMGIGAVLSFWWVLVGVPLAIAPLTWASVVQEVLLASVPLWLLFPLRRWFGYGRALVALVLVWPLWEWTYQAWPFSMRFYYAGNTQAANLAFVQFADLFGVWGVSAWVLLINVVAYQVWTASGGRMGVVFLRRFLPVMALLLAVPWGYGQWRVAMIEASAGRTIRVALVHTRLAPTRATATALGRAQALTDSAAHAGGLDVDLVVWPEGLVEGDAVHAAAVLDSTAARHAVPLLAGAAVYDSFALRRNRAVLRPGGAAYDKRHLVPLWEGLPFDRLLRPFASVEAYRRDHGLYTPGEGLPLLPLPVGGDTVEGDTLRLGTPICHEQNVPALWAAMARGGADVFVQLTSEGWFGRVGFPTLLANMARLRSIENRRATARCANGGRSVFIDATGRLYGGGVYREAVYTAPVARYTTISLYTRFPNLFPLLCLGGLVGLFLIRRLPKR